MNHYNVSRCRLAWGAAAFLILLTAACATSGDKNAEPPPKQSTTQTDAKADDSASGNANASGSAGRESVPVREDAPMRYVVKKGDTLWDIAGHFLDDPWYWPELWHANPDIENPHLIYPGDVLELVWVDGQPRLRRARTVRLSPKVRERPIEAAVPTIPVDAIRQFLDGPRLITPEQLENAPYIVQFLDEHLVGGAGVEIYVRHARRGDGRLFTVMRSGETYRDPETEQVLGYEAVPIGTAEILEFGEIATGVLTRTYREALTGDRLLPIEDEATLASNFHPHPPDHAVDGQIISVFNGVAEIGQYEIVVLNRGTNHGIERGHVLDIYQTGRQTRDPVTGEQLTLPPLRAGNLMVFNVEDRLSYGLVMNAKRPVHIGDSIHQPGGA